MIKKILLAMLLALFLLILSSCQTVQGVGRDIEGIGQRTALMLDGM
jgi:predicted small secreted protein